MQHDPISHISKLSYEIGIKSYERYQETADQTELADAINHFGKAVEGEPCAYFWLAKIATHELQNQSLSEEHRTIYREILQANLQKIANKLAHNPDAVSRLDYDQKLELFSLFYGDMNVCDLNMISLLRNASYNVIRSITRHEGEVELLTAETLHSSHFRSSEQHKLILNFFSAGMFGCSKGFAPLIEFLEKNYNNLPNVPSILEKLRSLQLQPFFGEDFNSAQNTMKEIINELSDFYLHNFDYDLKQIFLRVLIRTLLQQYQNTGPYNIAIFPIVENLMAELIPTEISHLPFEYYQNLLEEKKRLHLHQAEESKRVSQASIDEQIKIDGVYSYALNCEENESYGERAASCLNLINLIPVEKRKTQYAQEYGYAAYVTGSVRCMGAIAHNSLKELKDAKELLEAASKINMLSARYFLIKILQRNSQSKKTAQIKRDVTKHLDVIAKACSLSADCLPHLTPDCLFDLYKIFVHYGPNNPDFKKSASNILNKIIENIDCRCVPALILAANNIEYLPAPQPRDWLENNKYYFVAVLHGHQESLQSLVDFFRQRKATPITNLLIKIQDAYRSNNQFQLATIVLWEEFIKLLEIHYPDMQKKDFRPFTVELAYAIASQPNTTKYNVNVLDKADQMLIELTKTAEKEEIDLSLESLCMKAVKAIMKARTKYSAVNEGITETPAPKQTTKSCSAKKKKRKHRLPPNIKENSPVQPEPVMISEEKKRELAERAAQKEQKRLQKEALEAKKEQERLKKGQQRQKEKERKARKKQARIEQEKRADQEKMASLQEAKQRAQIKKERHKEAKRLAQEERARLEEIRLAEENASLEAERRVQEEKARIEAEHLAEETDDWKLSVGCRKN